MKINIDHTITGWRAWYTDGRRYDSGSSTWEELPRDGVLAFVLYHRTRPYRRIMTGVSLYWHINDIWACDNAADALIPEGASVKRGKWVADPEYAQVCQEVSGAKISPDEAQRIDR